MSNSASMCMLNNETYETLKNNTFYLRVGRPLTDQCQNPFPGIWLGLRDSTFNMDVCPEEKYQTREQLTVMSPAIQGQSSRRICAKKDKEKKKKKLAPSARSHYLFEACYMLVSGVPETPNPYATSSYTRAQLFLSCIQLISVT